VEEVVVLVTHLRLLHRFKMEKMAVLVEEALVILVELVVEE
jgi:hypothetical protein